ncbi:PSP1 domain-containing protein [Roseimarinus sediminis]|uniref:PSP1 domain-containing protein n=1 Tax=Roseimarinus sediminis TaxID=1610899 RepID=UPI003D230243
MSCTGCSLNKSDTESRSEMLNTYDWLDDLPDTSHLSNIIEVRFKGTRKEFFKNENELPLKRGDIVVLASNGGHDVGVVSLTGKLAEKQFNRKIKAKNRYQWFNVYRIARERDTERWKEAQKREKPVMIRARQVADGLGLDMKIGDVEFRGDGNKAIFYYIAEGRVDFRELIKVYAREFQIKIEMKQIGARQEAALIGGIGSCGRELCCSSWRTDFSSITAHMATRQGLSPNAEKLTGRCGKLKCCLMYELDTYLEAQEEFPTELLDLETSAGLAKQFKIDILQRQIWYSVESDKVRQNFVLNIDKVKEIINQNKRGKKPELAALLDPDGSLESKGKNMFNQNLTSDEKTISRRRKPRNKRNRNFKNETSGSGNTNHQNDKRRKKRNFKKKEQKQ